MLDGPFKTVEGAMKADIQRNAITRLVDQLLKIVAVVGVIVDACEKLEGLRALNYLCSGWVRMAVRL